MLLKVIFYSFLFYIIYKVIRFFSALNVTLTHFHNKTAQKPKGKNGKEIEDAQYEEID